MTHSWPFVESPWDLARRLKAAQDQFSDWSAAVRTVLVENSPELKAEYVNLPTKADSYLARRFVHLCDTMGYKPNPQQSPEQFLRQLIERAATWGRQQAQAAAPPPAPEPSEDPQRDRGEFTYATSGPRLQLDHLLAQLVSAVHEACEQAVDDDQPLPAIDAVGVEECKAIQRWAFEHVSDDHDSGEQPAPECLDPSVETTKAPTAEEMWDRFVAEMQHQQPIGKGKSQENFLNGLARCRQAFLDAAHRPTP